MNRSRAYAVLTLSLGMLAWCAFPIAAHAADGIEGISCSLGSASCPGAFTNPTNGVRADQPSFPSATITETHIAQNLGFFAFGGDVILNEPGSQTASDVLEFNGGVLNFGKGVFLFSDLEKGEFDITDVPIPPGFIPSSNAVFGSEVGPENNNGAIYTVFNADGSINAQYTIVSDAPRTGTPEPGSLALLGMGLAGLIGFRRRLFV